MLLIVYDEKYWKEIINFEALVTNQVISSSNLKLFSFCNSIDEAFIKITEHFEKYYLTQKEIEQIEPKVDLK